MLFTNHLSLALGTAQCCEGWPDPVTSRPRVVQRMFQSFCSLTAVCTTAAAGQMYCLGVACNRSCTASQRQPRIPPPQNHVCGHLPQVEQLTVHGVEQRQQQTYVGLALCKTCRLGLNKRRMCCSGKPATGRRHQVRASSGKASLVPLLRRRRGRMLVVHRQA